MAHSAVLIALDLSEESDQVIEKVQPYTDSGAELHLVHVVKPIEHVYGGFGAIGLAGDFSAQMANLETEAASSARQQLGEIGGRLGVPAERQHVPIGNAAHEIHRIAEDIGAGLIVVGSHGRHGLGLLLGSTANAVLHGAKCDVLAVRVSLPEG